jgi:hypothetical protein
MELSYHLYTEDLKRLSELIKTTDLLRENLIVENVGRFLVNQLDEAENNNSNDGNNGDESMRNVRLSTLRSTTLGGLGGGHESMRSTLDESPDVEEFELTTPNAGYGRQKSIMKNYS